MSMAIPNAIEQPIPPSVREILTAYSAKGSDADREVLLAILQAKAAEDQRITALATLNQQYVALQRHALEATTLAIQQQQQSTSSNTQSHQQQQHRRNTAGFPPSPYSNVSAATRSRSPSPPTPHLRSVIPPHSVSNGTSSSQKRRRVEDDSSHRQPPQSQRRRSNNATAEYTPPVSAPTTLPLSPSSSSGSHHQHQRSSSSSSSSASRAPPQHYARPDSPSSSPRQSQEHSSFHSRNPSPRSSVDATAAAQEADAKMKQSPVYRRLDINSMLSSGPPVSAMRGGSANGNDE